MYSYNPYNQHLELKLFDKAYYNNTHVLGQTTADPISIKLCKIFLDPCESIMLYIPTLYPDIIY